MYVIMSILFLDTCTIAQFLLLNLHARQQEELFHDKFTVNKTYIHTFPPGYYTQGKHFPYSTCSIRFLNSSFDELHSEEDYRTSE